MTPFLAKLEGLDGGETLVDPSRVSSIVVSRHSGGQGSAVFLHGQQTVLQVRGSPAEVWAEVDRQTAEHRARGEG